MRKPLFPLFLLLILLCLTPLCAQAGSAVVSGSAWYDASNDGIFNEDERLLASVEITLQRVEADGTLTDIDRQVTRSEGVYAFENVDAGQYRLAVTLPKDHQFVFPKAGGSVIQPAAGVESRSPIFTVSDGESKTEMHIGASKASCYIKAFVFVDDNQNGGRSTAEGLLRSVPISLYYEENGEWVKIAEEKTDKEGCATFWDLTPGTYRLFADLPEPYIFGPLGKKVNGWYNCIPPCDSGFGGTDALTIERGTSLGVGVGAVSTGNLSGVVWHDDNLNGLYDQEEGGYAGATLRLESAAAGVDRTVISDENGAFAFNLLLPGEYTLTASLPESAMFTLPDGDSLFSEGYDFTQSTTVSVQDKETLALQSIGVIDVTSLTVHVYNDLNANGAKDENEPVFSGAKIEVLQNEEVCASAVSDGSGVAFLPVIRGGACDLRAVLPTGQVFTIAGSHNDFVSPAATSDITQPMRFEHAVNTELYAGVTLPAAISGMLFDDADLSGMMGKDEKGLSGFIVQAVNADGDVVAQTETDADGRYGFHNLLPAAHHVRFQLVDAYVFTAASDTGVTIENNVISQTSTHGDTAAIQLTAGQQVENINGGVFRSATVSGAVLLSSGISSLPVSGGMENVCVMLLDESGAYVSDTTTAYTDADGAFYLKGALPGTYMLEYLLPAGAAFTQPETGAESIVTEPFTVGSADDLVFDPIFAIHTGSLSGVLYHDVNLNTAYDPGEQLLSNVQLTLENTDLGMVYETTTLDSGEYIFESLRPGAYTLHLTLPEEYCFSTDASSFVPAQTAALASVSFDIGMGQALEGCNIAVARPASIDGVVFFDRANDGARSAEDDGVANVTLSFKSTNGPQSYTLLSDENGAFKLPAIVPGEYIVRVSLESDCIPADHNPAVLDGGFWTSMIYFLDNEATAPEYAILRYAHISGRVWSMDGTLTGVSGRSVSLYRQDELVETTLTDAEGHYAFNDLKPGEYSISCDLPDASYRFARTPDTGMQPSLILGDLSRQENGLGYSDAFTLAMGENKTGCDVGMGAMGSLGDTAWIDENGNGLQDANEPNLPGLEISLYQYGELVAQTVTDAFGHYLIRDLYPGYYTVQVKVPEKVKPTVQMPDYPFVSSVLTPTENDVAQASEIIVPSGAQNLNCDFGFILRKDGAYPDTMEQLHVTDWSFNTK